MALYPDYATASELKSYLRIPTADTEDDAELALAITSASRAIDRATNRQFGVHGSAVARYFTPEWDTVRLAYTVPIFDLMTTTSMVVEADLNDDGVYETAITDYRLVPVNAAADLRPWTDIIFGDQATLSTRRASLKITANWGWSSVPAAIENACLLQASRLFKRRDAPFGVAGSPDLGSELRLLERLDPDVAVLVGRYRRWWSAK